MKRVGAALGFRRRSQPLEQRLPERRCRLKNLTVGNRSQRNAGNLNETDACNLQLFAQRISRASRLARRREQAHPQHRNRRLPAGDTLLGIPSDDLNVKRRHLESEGRRAHFVERRRE